MNKKGFTLLELLAVVVIVAIVGVSATISFGNIEEDTSVDELTNKYIEIQRAANLYMDLHNSDIDWFKNNGEIYYKIAALEGENYITSDLSNPVTGGTIDSNYFVKIFMVKDETLEEGNPRKDLPIQTSSCIVKRTMDENGLEKEECIADHLGNFSGSVSCN